MQTFPGTKAELKALPGMTFVELTNQKAVRMMQAFARTYPWDWNADIGLIPLFDGNRLLRDAALRATLALAHHPGVGMVAKAVVVDREGAVLESASDGRADHGGNPCLGAPIVAMGRAGSSVNLRECAVGFLVGRDAPVGIADFGLASMGCCELFRPAAVFSNAPFDDELTGVLEGKGIAVFGEVAAT